MSLKKMNKLSNIQKDILKYLLKQNMIMTSYYSINDEKLRSKYTQHDLLLACNELINQRYISSGNTEGFYRIATAESLKQIKSLFPFQSIYKSYIHGNFIKIFLYIWDNVIIRIFIPLAVAYLIFKFNLK